MSNKAKTDPVIGITCSSEARAKPYSSIVERFGGEVKYLIPGRKETWKEDVSEIDGLLLSGGLPGTPSSRPQARSRKCPRQGRCSPPVLPNTLPAWDRKPSLE